MKNFKTKFKCQCLEERNLIIRKPSIYGCVFKRVECEGCGSIWEIKFKSLPSLKKDTLQSHCKLVVESQALKDLLEEEKKFQESQNADSPK